MFISSFFCWNYKFIVRYKIKELPDGQPNLPVEQFFQQASLPIYPHAMQPIVDVDDLASKLISWCTGWINTNCVLIIYPNISIALNSIYDKVYVYDSHCHGSKGALVAFSSIERLHELCAYLEKMLTTYFGVHLNGCNLILVEMYD